MSRENVELFREGLRAIQRGDMEWILEHVTEDVVLRQPSELPDARTYRGPEGVLEAFAGFPAEWDDFRLELRELVDVDPGHVVALVRNHGRGKASGVVVELDIAYAARFENGKTAEMNLYLTMDEAFEAVGLPE